MREVGDGFDLMVGVLALVIMLTVGVWSLFTIRNNMEVQVDEKLESRYPGLYIIGDGSGITHSLSHASASGVFVARQIAEE